MIAVGAGKSVLADALKVGELVDAGTVLAADGGRLDTLVYVLLTPVTLSLVGTLAPEVSLHAYAR